MKFYSLMSGAGFEGGAYSHDWIMAWVAIGIIGILCYLAWFAQKQDMLPFPFHFMGGLLGMAAAFFVVFITGSYKIALIIGLICFLAGGYFVGTRQGG